MLLVIFACCDATRTISETEYTAFVHGRVIDGTGAEAIPDGVVLIKGDRIIAVSSWNDADIPNGSKVFDIKGKTILPGIIDSHVHSTALPAERLVFLRAGVTSVCDLGSPIELMPEFRKNHDGKYRVARGFRAGPIITTPGGLPDAILQTDLNFEVATPEEAGAGVAHLSDLGAEVIKIYLEPWEGIDMLDLEQVKAIVKEAHAQGVQVRAHVSKLAALDVALEGGVDLIEHVPKPRLDSAELEKELADSHDPLEDLFNKVVVPEYDTQLPRMIEKGVIFVPTLARGLGRFYKDGNAREEQRVLAEAVLEIVRRFHSLGGTIAMGTDYYPEMPGDAGKMHLREIELLQAAGLTPMEVIESCTRHAAAACGRGKELGTLEGDKLADMIVVDGDPLSDLEVLGAVAMVIVDGEIVFRAEE
jgi:enamidase